MNFVNIKTLCLLFILTPCFADEYKYELDMDMFKKLKLDVKNIDIKKDPSLGKENESIFIDSDNDNIDDHLEYYVTTNNIKDEGLIISAAEFIYTYHLYKKNCTKKLDRKCLFYGSISLAYKIRCNDEFLKSSLFKFFNDKIKKNKELNGINKLSAEYSLSLGTSESVKRVKKVLPLHEIKHCKKTRSK